MSERTPIRSKPFHSPIVIGKAEKQEILSVLNKKEFSRFMGSPSRDTEKLLTMNSADALDYEGQYFSFLGGRMIRRFEANFAKKFNSAYAVSVNSATSGLMSALGALGIGPGDEVITTCLSFNATATSILAFNAIPVFADVSEGNFCIAAREIEKKISEKTRAILVVHLLGNAAEMDPIMNIAKRHKLAVIEDCAQAPGAKYKGRYVGTIGDIGVFSFQETKNITTGEGGMIVTDNTEYAKKCRLIRNHGESIPDIATPEEDLVNNIGFNFRMTELTAALGIGQLGRLDENNRVRKENALYLAEKLRGIPGLQIPEEVTQNGNVPHIFPFLYDYEKTGVKREIVIEALRAEGIPVGSGYQRLMPENPMFLKRIAYGKKGCPFTCEFYKKKVRYDVKDYPTASGLIYGKFIWFYHINNPNTIKDMDDVVRAFKKVFSNIDTLKSEKIHERGKALYKW